MLAPVRASLVRLTAHVSSLRARIEAAGIERSFFVCSTPRTGSTMLGNLLADTGLVGRAGEAFGEPFRRDVVPTLSRREFDDYLVRESERRARGTCTLGYKLHWDQVELFLYLLRLRRGLRRATDAEVIAAVFPEPRYVLMSREDSLAQAVSWWRSITTGKWIDGETASGEPRFDAAGIGERLRRIDAHNRAWRRWFETNGVEPFRLTYEQLVSDPSGEARRILEFVGVDVPAGFAIAPRTEVQADALNREWIERYRELESRSGSQAASTT
jgi:trehalose 2-sulfotransferase